MHRVRHVQGVGVLAHNKPDADAHHRSVQLVEFGAADPRPVGSAVRMIPPNDHLGWLAHANTAMSVQPRGPQPLPATKVSIPDGDDCPL